LNDEPGFVGGVVVSAQGDGVREVASADRFDAAVTELGTTYEE